MLKYQQIIDIIREAEALGLIPNIPGNLTDEQINARIDELYSTPPTDSETLRRQEQLVRMIDVFDDKGIMDELYPQGYETTKKKIFKRNP